jgi:hypothetical protein
LAVFLVARDDWEQRQWIDLRWRNQRNLQKDFRRDFQKDFQKDSRGNFQEFRWRWVDQWVILVWPVLGRDVTQRVNCSNPEVAE